ncbi:MAG: hypothetical protein WBL45_11945 [Solirubrobacterales bacterium]
MFDLNGPALEVAIGLAFAFFLLSIVASAITEGISWATNQRAKTLEKGLKGMFGDDDVAADVLAHPLAKTDMSSAVPDRKPAYLSSRNFGLALVDTLKERGGGNSEDSLAKLSAGVNAVRDEASPLGKQLDALVDEAGDGDLADFRKASERWFDDGMDRVSGLYKRWAQKVAIVAALIVAIALNASAVRIAERLAADPTVRSAVVTGAEGAVTRSKTSPKATGEAAQNAVKELETLKVPILWGAANNPLESVNAFLAALAGWLITAIAISLGAPFWFDALGKLAHLKTSGRKPATSG